MWHLTLRNLLAHRGRFALTLLAVVLSVTFISGSLMLTDTSERLLEDQFRTASAGVDITIRDAAAFDSAMGVEVERDPLAAGLLDQVAQVPGVGQAHPVADGQGVLEVGGEAVVPAGASLLSSYSPEPLGAFTVRQGRAPENDGEVAIDLATARTAGVAPGDTVAVLTDHRTILKVVGLVGFAEADGMPGATVALVPLHEAQRMLGTTGGYSEILVTTTDDASVQDVLDQLRTRLGERYAVSSAQDSAAASASAAQEQIGSLTMVLTAMSAAALLVGAMLIANTFAIVTNQRRREIALLRAAGATTGQVSRSILGEALVIGLLGSALGVGMGVLAADGLRTLGAAFGTDLPDGPTVLSASTVVISLLLGLGVTLVSAVGAARRVARVAPVEALRDSAEASPATRARGRKRSALRLLPLGAGLAGTAAVLAGAPALVLVPAALATVAGIALLGPAVTPVLAQVVGAPLARMGLPGRLARQSAARAPRRTTATAMALALSLALIAFMTVVATSLKEGLSGTYRETVTADLVIESSRAEMLGGLSPHVVQEVDGLAEIATTSRVRYGHWLDGGTTSALTALDPDTVTEVTDLDLVAGSLDALDSGGVVVAQSVAAERGLAVGDTVEMTFSYTGDQQLEVVGILESLDAQALSTSWFVSLETYAEHFTEDMDASVLLRVADGVDVEEAAAAVEAALVDHPTADVRDQATAAAARGATVQQVLGLVTVLLVLTVIIALLGITNTLALSVSERTREIGLLRAVGASRAQVAWMIRAEAVLVAALASLLGLGLGVGLGAATVRALGQQAPLAVALPTGRLALVVAVALAAGLLAGLLPARRAARIDVLRAITTH
ncbi:FtsX-like permease family protein [Ornithinimicrobium pekingense]|uniref:ABC transporter substrate-binding protein n=1 Tax=Ornithinimicrobium pekingense TaxID=384677 RepID=A0ABQ2F8D3_9MICO|nr:ABC transporter permease [Ornithinimicrobium pekingense]GGK63266.1 ABC transporter substrate-binding protein [Ornithinimicrobium pekingense]